uniref:Uncharacterized protein n=1 Tax=Tanacetum cinerariifolium TaxID=118510 RepID=A0A699H5A8_TANCI|nr:hypothetical protein [Tanacetum cinerariifolium]
MPNPEDISDPTTAMNMALVLMNKEFKINYSTPTNNNQRILSNPRNRQIAQPGMSMGQDRQIQMVSSNGRNQFRQYDGQNAGNQMSHPQIRSCQNRDIAVADTILNKRSEGMAEQKERVSRQCVEYITMELVDIVKSRVGYSGSGVGRRGQRQDDDHLYDLNQNLDKLMSMIESNKEENQRAPKTEVSRLTEQLNMEETYEPQGITVLDFDDEDDDKEKNKELPLHSTNTMEFSAFGSCKDKEDAYNHNNSFEDLISPIKEHDKESVPSIFREGVMKANTTPYLPTLKEPIIDDIRSKEDEEFLALSLYKDNCSNLLEEVKVTHTNQTPPQMPQVLTNKVGMDDLSYTKFKARTKEELAFLNLKMSNISMVQLSSFAKMHDSFPREFHRSESQTPCPYYEGSHLLRSFSQRLLLLPYDFMVVGKEIIDEYDHELIQVRFAHLIHEVYEYLWCVGQTKWNDLKLEMSITGPKCGLAISFSQTLIGSTALAFSTRLVYKAIMPKVKHPILSQFVIRLESVPIIFSSASSVVYLVSKADATMSLGRLNSKSVMLLSARFYVLAIIMSFTLMPCPLEVSSAQESNHLHDSNSLKGDQAMHNLGTNNEMLFSSN